MDVTVIKSRRKTLTLTVNRLGEVIVRAPYKIKETEISHFVAAHCDWIDARIAEREKSQLNLEDGVEYMLFGERAVLASGKVGFSDGVLRLPQEGREDAFRAYLIKLAHVRMAETVQKLAEEYGFQYKGVRISGARGRWGSCSAKGAISFSFRIAFLPPDISRAVAVHELCHTRYLNHSAAFWREVEKIIPNYSLVRKTLKSYQYIMNYL